VQKLVLVDGSGYIFRAFYALPPMTRADGTPVNAVYGFTKMLMKLMKTSNAAYFAVVFDAARKNFRNDIYPAYKGTRKETPPELIPQFPLIREAVKAFNIVSVEQEGYEADDLIATYAKLGLEKGLEVKVVSSDKDMMQLVHRGVTLYDSMKDKIISEDEVKAKFGVTSEKLLDVMALIGDASDNVPGVSGFGPKTAAELITAFGTLENLLQSTSLIKQEKRRQTLIAEKDMALLSKRLITLEENVPLITPLSALAIKKPDCDTIITFARNNGFNSLLPSIEAWCNERKNNIPKPEIKKEYELVTDIKALKKWVDEAKEKGAFAIDTETTGLNPFKADIVGISLATDAGKACYIPLAHGTKPAQADLFGNFLNQKDADAPKQLAIKDALAALAPLFADESILKIGHNIKFDMHVLKKAFAESGLNFTFTPVSDSMVMSYDLYGTQHGHGMDELAKLYLDYQTISFKDVTGEGKDKITFAEVPLEKALDYAAEDADITLRLHSLFAQVIKDSDCKVYENLDRPLISVLYDMEEDGVEIDSKALGELSQTFTKKMNELSEVIFAEAGEEFNINSPAQLGTILFDKMGITGGQKGANGYYSTDSEVLEGLAAAGVKLAELVLQFRTLAKLKSTYTDALPQQISPRDGRVHTTFSQTVTSTGRLSSTDPNLQNIPIRNDEGKLIRAAFIAPKGKVLIAADYSQVELRLMAGIANVKRLKEDFQNGQDIHATTASAVFGVPMDKMTPDLRRQAKAINFGIIYGISAFGLARQIGVSRTEAAKYIEAYFAKYPEIKLYMDETIKKARTKGYVTTLMGRKCYTYGINDKNPNRKGFAERAAINAPIQGSAADIIKKVMLELPSKLKAAGLSAKMLLQVHDELLFEADEVEAEATAKLVKDTMETIIPFPVPLPAEAGIGKNWNEAH